MRNSDPCTLTRPKLKLTQVHPLLGENARRAEILPYMIVRKNHGSHAALVPDPILHADHDTEHNLKQRQMHIEAMGRVS